MRLFPGLRGNIVRDRHFIGQRRRLPRAVAPRISLKQDRAIRRSVPVERRENYFRENTCFKKSKQSGSPHFEKIRATFSGFSV